MQSEDLKIFRLTYLSGPYMPGYEKSRIISAQRAAQAVEILFEDKDVLSLIKIEVHS